jgi:dienelactone hydrolase
LVSLYGEDYKTLVGAIKCPILCYPAGDDSDFHKPGGEEQLLLSTKSFANKNEFKVFPDAKHGFVSRLPLEDVMQTLSLSVILMLTMTCGVLFGGSQLQFVIIP